MPTQIEKLLSHKKKRSGILVPLLEDFLMKPLNIESEDDAGFVRHLLSKQIEREKSRSLNNFYSPSALSSCLRQVYFARNHKELGIKRKAVTRMDMNYYFLTGNWLHLKWQFALFKLNKALPWDVFSLWGLEVPVVSKHGDHGGTADAICAIYEKLYVIDFKGVNVRTFGQAVLGNVQMSYKVQISDYVMLANVDRNIKAPKIESGLIVFENKGGPDSKHPIALHEVEVPVKDYLPEIKFRLGRLREHEKEETTPPPECSSIGETQFLGCPFRDECRSEVKKIQSANSSDSKKHRVAVPTKRRANRSKRSKS
jgi:hypothetical protein